MILSQARLMRYSSQANSFLKLFAYFSDMKNLLFTIFLFLGFSQVFARQLSPEEKKLIAEVEKNYASTLQLLEEVVNINSGSLNKEGVKAVGDVFAREFQKIGFETEWIELPAAVNRAGHFVAKRKGTKERKSSSLDIWIPYLRKTCLFLPTLF